MTLLAVWVLAGTVLWAIVLALPWRPWSTRERLQAGAGTARRDFRDTSVLIPARNEAEVIARTLRGVAAQGSGIRIVLVDDQSTDGTADVARGSSLAAGVPAPMVVSGRPLPEGWTGKVWALHQGRPHLQRRYCLLLDADIELAPGTLEALRARLVTTPGGMVSVMAELPALGWWERVLVPAFVYFFKLLYPFGLSAAASSRVAAAAGGCVLIETATLDRVGAFESLQDALIDDCTLARRVKGHGGCAWIGLTRSAVSLRSRGGMGDVWRMVSRTAFTQLDYSVWWLSLCTALMLTAFVAPLAGLAGPGAIPALSALALAMLAVTYVPTLRYYGVHPLWSLTLPVAGVLYLAMTWHSALQYWRGRGSAWKGRTYAARGKARPQDPARAGIEPGVQSG